LREYDFLARYAGDEFVAIVQELVGNQVEDLRNRIETAVSEFSLKIRGNGEARVGISVGTATFGIEGDTLDQLLVAADQAMYRAKSTHKLEKVTREIGGPESIVELESDNLASVSVN
jgi:diguanylate cyclase (GGDEF)-like protein